MRLHIFVLSACLLLFANPLTSQTIDGFTAANAKTQQDLEAQFDANPTAANIEKYLLHLTEEPHIAGSPESKQVAEYINKSYSDWGLSSKLVEYQAYLPYPETVELTLLEPESLRLSLREPTWKFDKDSYDERAVLPFNAYSPSGDVTAQVVYVNRGLPDDYDELEELGIDVTGKIALVRYGGSFRGVKAQVAEEHGASGLIIYSDPADDGYMRGDIYPNGPMRHPDAVQRGSLLYIFHYPGDPLTPNIAAKQGVKSLKPEEAKTLARVPTTPISYGQAEHILRGLAGPEVPNAWQGGLPFRYHIGPGPAKIHLNLKMDYAVRPIYDVIATIPGSEKPDEWVIIGNHHDAWVYGAVDPNSGTASVMEIGRALGEMLKNGWQPKRTIVLAHWDAEEYGLIGSTEWVEELREELIKKAAIYINIDVAVTGEIFGVGAVPSLDKFIQNVVKDVSDPTTGKSVFERWWADGNKKTYKRNGQTLPDTAATEVNRLGSGSDYTAFLQFAGIPSLSMTFSGRYGVYHSILDNFFWMKSWGDPTFKYHEAMAKVGGKMVLRFAQADVLPFNYADYADAILTHISDTEKALQEKFDEPKIDLTPLTEKTKTWKASCDSLQNRIQNRLTSGGNFDEINQLLMQLERNFTVPEGLIGREWFKHTIYAPGFYTGYASKPLPGVAEAAEAEKWEQANEELQRVLRVLDKAIAMTNAVLD